MVFAFAGPRSEPESRAFSEPVHQDSEDNHVFLWQREKMTDHGALG